MSCPGPWSVKRYQTKKGVRIVLEDVDGNEVLQFNNAGDMHEDVEENIRLVKEALESIGYA